MDVNTVFTNNQTLGGIGLKRLEHYNSSVQLLSTVFENIESFLEQPVDYSEATISKQKIIAAVETINKESSDGLQLDLRVVLSFAAGIQAFMGPARKFFSTGGFSGFSEQETIFLAIALIGSMQKKDAATFRALLNRVLAGKANLKRLVFLARNIFLALMKRLHTVGSMGAFTVLLIPIMNALMNATGTGGISSVNQKMIQDIILGMGINYSFYALGSGIKNTFIKLKNKFSKI